jgi:hypothetical protein
MLLDVVKVEAEAGYTLVLEFENGERRRFDVKPLLDRRPFERLRNLGLFAMAKVEYGTVVWPGNIDIAPETLYDRSTPMRSTGSDTMHQRGQTPSMPLKECE